MNSQAWCDIEGAVLNTGPDPPVLCLLPHGILSFDLFLHLIHS